MLRTGNSAEERLRRAFEYAPIATGLVRPDGSWLGVNRALCDMTGYSQQQLLNRSFSEIMDVGVDLGELQRMLDGEGTTHKTEACCTHAGGHSIDIRLAMSLVRNSHREAGFFIAQIEEVVGRSGHFAHDLNNLLSVIINYAALTADELVPGTDAWRDLQEVRKAGERAAALAQQIGPLR